MKTWQYWLKVSLPSSCYELLKKFLETGYTAVYSFAASK